MEVLNLAGSELENRSAAYEYQTLMNMLHVSVSKHLLDKHFTVVWANNFYYELIGWPKEEYEAVFHNQCDRYYENDPDEWERIYSSVTDANEKKQTGYSLVSRIRQKNGDSIWVQFSNTFIDEYIGGYQVAYTVITDIDHLVRVQKEQSVTYDNLPGFVAKYRVDRDFSLFLLDANHRFVEFFGAGCWNNSGDALLKQNIGQNRAVLEAHQQDILAGKTVHFVMRLKSRHGMDAWMQVSGACYDWQDGSPVYLAIFLDVTDLTELREMQKQLEKQARELREALSMAEKANRAKSDFLSRMSHDIRTPMNAIIGMTEIAFSHQNEPERVKNCLEKISVSSKHLLGLINDVLDMSAIESGKLSLSNGPLSLPGFMENVVAMIRPAAEKKGQKLFIRLRGVEHELLWCDALRLKQVFINILSNAVKFTPAGGSITLEAEELPQGNPGMGSFRFAFSDTGVGMKAEFLERIFEDFTREQDSRVDKTEGSGLGMAITKRIVDLLGGSIQVESQVDHGTRFEIILALELDPRQQEKITLPPLHILVVDDDEAMCECAAHTLEALGVTVECVTSGYEAVKRAAGAKKTSRPFDAVILDWRMPGMDGAQTARELRSAVGAQLPILIASAYDWTEIEKDALASDIQGFVPKPLFRSTLLRGIQRYILGESGSSDRQDDSFSPYDFSGMRVLLVEDNEFNREIASELLSPSGVLVDSATDGAKGCEMIEKSSPFHYDLILMDIQMPVMNGYEAAKKIRSMNRPDAKSIPILALTADAFAKDVKAAAQAGMNGHLAKPLDVEAMMRELGKYLKNTGTSPSRG